jgi:hypothetical protein
VPAPVSRTLDDPKHHRETKFLGYLCHRLKMTSLNLDGLIEIMSVNFFLKTRFKSCAVGVLNPEGIAGRKRLAKRDEATATLLCFHTTIDNFLKRCRAFQPDWRNLGQANGQLIAFTGGHRKILLRRVALQDC